MDVPFQLFLSELSEFDVDDRRHVFTNCNCNATPQGKPPARTIVHHNARNTRQGLTRDTTKRKGIQGSNPIRRSAAWWDPVCWGRGYLPWRPIVRHSRGTGSWDPRPKQGHRLEREEATSPPEALLIEAMSTADHMRYGVGLQDTKRHNSGSRR